MEIPLYQIDTFTNEVFKGNPAAICPLDSWISEDVMLKIASENNLSETGFFVKESNGYHIRWFTPTVEVDLCGHATLAAAYVLYNHLNCSAESIDFQSRSGRLNVRKSNAYFVMNFPVDKIAKIALTDELTAPFNFKPKAAYRGLSDYMLVFENEDLITNLSPDLSLIAKINARGVIVTAKGRTTDFVSRYFAPQSGVNEDPVTGSTHTTLTPFWSEVLNKKQLVAKQLSKRGGGLKCTDLGQRIEISGQAVTYLTGSIRL